jgi:hypothetical protein
VSWWSASGSGSLLSYITPFRYNVEFTPVKGSDGKWHAPAWVLDNLKMNFGDHVLLLFPGATEMRIRWFEGGEFHNFSYPDPAEFGLLRAQGLKRPSGLGGEEIIPLPTNPIIKGLTGVLTVKGQWGEEKILRYGTSGGVKFLGKQAEREPLVIGLVKRSGAVKILTSGDYADTSSLTFERSRDLKVWHEIVTDQSDPDYGVLDYDGMRVLPPEAPEFYRARYKQ